MPNRELCPRAAMKILLLASVWLAARAGPALAEEPKLLVLTETGHIRNGLPVLLPHPGGAEIEALFSRGFSGRLLRLYQYEQEYLRRATGLHPEPAYLLLSGQRGGFPRFGFYLENLEKKRAGYVDLHKSSSRKGRFGSMDQIFPHELAHIIMRQLAGEPRPGRSNQMHAIAVRTDPQQAFQEGFAEHFQVMAIEDPDADPATAALLSDSRHKRLADDNARRYRRELEARWNPAGPMRMGFLFWFSGTEQVWRYYGVTANVFAHETLIPERMIASGDYHSAYLIQNTLPGDLHAAPKAVPVLLSTEGAVSTLFYRWNTERVLVEHYREEEFYRLFGASRAAVSAVENSYLKMFHVLHLKKPADTAAFVDGYKAVFPDESAGVDRLVQEVLLGRPLQVPSSIWLANPSFRTGTSLFDQFRSLPRIHTFDLNAATPVELLAVPGVSRELAERILDGAPYSDLADLGNTIGLTQDIFQTFVAMSSEMERLAQGSAEDETVLNLNTIVWSYGRRALVILGLASLAGSFLYRRVRPVGWFRTAVNGLSASCLVLALAWMTAGTAPHIALLGPLLCFGSPAAVLQWVRVRRPAAGLRVLLAWTGASLPAVTLAYPWF